MDWEQAKVQDNKTTIPSTWIHIHYYEALNALFRIENTLRIFVYIVLKNNLFDKWPGANIMSDDTEQATIATIAKKRISQAQNFGYLGYGINCPIMHLTSGELIRIITDENYWQYFRPYFSASKQIVRHKLDEIGVIRNSLAHFRLLKSDDVELLKQNANHVLSNVEHYLLQLGFCFNVVPTNTQDDWYKSLSTLGTELCTLRLLQCEDERWVKLAFTYKTKTLSSKEFMTNYHSHTILNLITPAILEYYKNITKYATCLTEESAYAMRYNPEKPSFSKSFSIFFNRDVISAFHEDLKTDIESLLSTITQETDLISNDNLARGKIISVARVSAILPAAENRKYWTINTDTTLCPDTKGEFPEYWGDTSLHSSMVTSAGKYPWMPIAVSDIGIPF